jgi:hypothetical protein
MFGLTICAPYAAKPGDLLRASIEGGLRAIARVRVSAHQQPVGLRRTDLEASASRLDHDEHAAHASGIGRWDD